MNRAHVLLLVEDHDDIRAEVADICASLGFEVECVGTQQEAEAALAQRSFCLVILDLEIPVRPKGPAARVQTGFNTLENIRAERSFDELPVVVITAHGKDHKLCRRAMKLGAYFVKKPFAEDEDPLEDVLKAQLATACERRHPGGCPNLQSAASGRAGRAKLKKGTLAAPARVYACRHQIHFVGDSKDRGYLLLVDQAPVRVQLSTFELLLRLAVAQRRGGAYVVGTELGALDYHRKVSRARSDLQRRTNGAVDPKALIESDGQKGYRLSVPPELLSADEGSLATHHETLMKRLGGW